MGTVIEAALLFSNSKQRDQLPNKVGTSLDYPVNPMHSGPAQGAHTCSPQPVFQMNK